MRAKLQRKDLISHQKTIKTAKSRLKAINDNASVIISVSDHFSVSGPGFKQKMPCESMEWGTIKVPYKIWNHLIRNLNKLSKDQEIIISFKNNAFSFASCVMENTEINSVNNSKIQRELPINPTPKMVLEYIVGQDHEQLHSLGLSEIARSVINDLDNKAIKAATYLKDYEITVDDLRKMIANKFGVTDYDKFLNLIEYSKK